MRKMNKLWCVILILCAYSVIAVANNQNDGDELSITVAPNVLVLKSPVPCITVHSNIPASGVDFSSVSLNGVVPYLVKADLRDHLVAKFHTEDIASIVNPGNNLLTLTGTLNGASFTVSDIIKVK